jgi:putative heme-binding domain-containing protein
MIRCGRFVTWILLAVAPLAADDPGQVIPHRQDRPPNEPYAPAEAIRRMTVPEGFSVELVAAEPDLVNPIAMTFDDRGRIWVTESLEYPRKEAGPGRDRVKVLESTRGDGRFDKVSVFAEGLNIPTGVAVGHGGVWVLNAPDLLFLKEKDGKEVGREVVVTGFGRADTHELPNSLTWGPDGWLYGLNGVFNPSRVASRGKVFDFTCALWRVHPRTREFQLVCQGTSNPWGLVWDPEGAALVSACHWANDHVFHFVETGYYQRQAGPYPPFTIPIGSVTNHSHQKTAYCGLCYFDSDAYPEKYRGRLYMGNIHGGCVNVDVLRRDGSTYVSDGEPDFLTAHDAWFMPVSQKVGPDGCLYVLDWYDRYHCYQDASRDPKGVDRDRGRLYRVRYKGTPPAGLFDLAREGDDQLIERLHSPNIYFREAAQRLLCERVSPALRAKLEKLVLDDHAPRKARLHGLWALVGTGQLEPGFHARLLAHADPAYRAWGVRAAGNLGQVSPAVRDKVAALARDPAPDVQLQVAIAARKVEGLDALAVLVDVLAHCGQDKLIPLIVWPNLHPLLDEQSARFVQLAGKVDLNAAPALAKLMSRVVERILSGRNPDIASVPALLAFLPGGDAEHARACLSVISARAREMRDADLGALKTGLQPILEKILAGKADDPLYLSARLLAAQLRIGSTDAGSVRRLFVSPEQPEATRLQALEALIAFRDPGLPEAVAGVLASGSPRFLGQVLDALGRWDDPKVANLILDRYAKMDPELQPLAVELLMQRQPWTRKLLDAVLAKRLPPGVLNANHLRRILDGNDREAVWAVEKAFGTVRTERNPEREKVVAEMGKYLRQHPGDPRAGRLAFKKVCAQCHVIYGEGASVGPDLTANGRASFEQLLSNVFDPSLVIGPGYQATTVVTKGGRTLTGLVTEDSPQRVVLKLPGGAQQVVPRGDVEYAAVSKLSMMPEGIETLMDRKELADLFAFLTLDRPPDDPEARPIPGAPGRDLEGRVRVEKSDRKLVVRARLPLTPPSPPEGGEGGVRGGGDWAELVTYVTDPSRRPYLHPVRDPSGRTVLTEDTPADHPWQHGIFTGFHEVNGLNYWKEDQGRQRFVRLLDLKEEADRVSWRSLTELVAPDGRVVLEEEQAVTVHAPEKADAYRIDFDLLLRARDRDVTFGKFAVGGLAARMRWEKGRPRHTHLNAKGDTGRACDQKRAAWCTVERPFGDETFGIALFDHPDNPNHPAGWRVDEQGLINPAVSLVGGWSLSAGKERGFRYGILIYRGPGRAEPLERQFKAFAAARTAAPGDGSQK